MVAGEFKDGWMHGKGIYTVKGRVGGAQDASGKAGVHVFEGDYLDGARDGQVFASAPACLSATPCYAVLPDVEQYGKRHRMPYNRHRKQRWPRAAKSHLRRAQRACIPCQPGRGVWAWWRTCAPSLPVRALPLAPHVAHRLRVFWLLRIGHNKVRQQDSI